MTEARTLNVRLLPEDDRKLKDLRKFYRVDTDSTATRILIRERWDKLQHDRAWKELGEELP